MTQINPLRKILKFSTNEKLLFYALHEGKLAKEIRRYKVHLLLNVLLNIKRFLFNLPVMMYHPERTKAKQAPQTIVGQFGSVVVLLFLHLTIEVLNIFNLHLNFLEACPIII